MSLRILLADDNARLREKLVSLVESRPGWRVVGEAVNGREVVEKAGQLKPDVTLLDYSMPELDGISAIGKIHGVAPDTEIVMLTVHDASFTVGRAIEAGARGYVVKSEITRDLIQAVEAAGNHKTFISALDNPPDASSGQKSAG